MVKWNKKRREEHSKRMKKYWKTKNKDKEPREIVWEMKLSGDSWVLSHIRDFIQSTQSKDVSCSLIYHKEYLER